MTSERKLEEATVRETKQKQKERRKQQKAATEIIVEILKSKRTLFKTEDQMKGILKRKIGQINREFRIKQGLALEETDLQEIVLAISDRDENIFDILCHRIRNRIVSLGGFPKRIGKLIKKIMKAVKDPSLNEISKEIEKDAKIISQEVKRAEKRLKKFH